jgi:hypothetical protein
METNKIKITEQITTREWNWIDHNLRKENSIEKAVEWNPQGKRERGRPKRSRQRTIREEDMGRN